MPSSTPGVVSRRPVLLMLLLAVAALVSSAVGADLVWSWRADEHAALVRVDVLGHERALVMSAVGDARQLAIATRPEDTQAMEDVLALIAQSWVAVTDGGPELGRDLSPTGRQLVAWEAASEQTQLGADLQAFVASARSMLAYGLFVHQAMLDQFAVAAEELVGELDRAVLLAGEEGIGDRRVVTATVMFVVSAGAVVALGVGMAARQRRRAVTSFADERLRRLLEHAQDASLVIGPTGQPKWVSPAFERVIGLPPPQTRAGLLGLVHPEDERATRERLRAVFAEVGSSTTFELRTASDATERQLRVVATNHTDDPFIDGLLVTLTDVTEERTIRNELARAAALHQFVADTSSDLLLRATSDGEITYASSAAGPLLGVYPEDIIGARLAQLVERDDAPAFLAALEEARHSGGVAMVDARASLATAWRAVWLGISCQYVIGPDGDREFHISMRDTTERVQATRRLAEERQLLEATLASVQAAVLVVDADAAVVKVNAAYEELLGFCPQIGDDLADVGERFRMLDAAGRPLAVHDRPLACALDDDAVVDLAATIIDVYDRRHEVIANAVPLHDETGDVSGAVLTIHDVTPLRAAQEELRRLATVDALTGLPNRRLLMQHLDNAIARHQRAPHRLVVMFLDLDGFKAVNDQLGHDRGDELLIAVGRRLEATVRIGDLVARLGGDEFVVVVEHLDGDDAVQGLRQRIERVLSVPIDLSVGDVHIGGSVGVAVNDGLSTAEELLARADAAMYERKRARKARVG